MVNNIQAGSACLEIRLIIKKNISTILLIQKLKCLKRSDTDIRIRIK